MMSNALGWHGWDTSPRVLGAGKYLTAGSWVRRGAGMKGPDLQGLPIFLL